LIKYNPEESIKSSDLNVLTNPDKLIPTSFKAELTQLIPFQLSKLIFTLSFKESIKKSIIEESFLENNVEL